MTLPINNVSRLHGCTSGLRQTSEETEATAICPGGNRARRERTTDVCPGVPPSTKARVCDSTHHGRRNAASGQSAKRSVARRRHGAAASLGRHYAGWFVSKRKRPKLTHAAPGERSFRREPWHLHFVNFISGRMLIATHSHGFATAVRTLDERCTTATGVSHETEPIRVVRRRDVADASGP